MPIVLYTKNKLSALSPFNSIYLHLSPYQLLFLSVTFTDDATYCILAEAYPVEQRTI